MHRLKPKIIETLIRIRCVEEKFLDLFSEGRMNGTVHTCIGQELSAIAFAGQLEPSDFVFSNHRCHGHYLAYTGDWEGLISELMGKEDGVCGGVGSSQHLQKNNFFSNGIQGGIVPLAAGFAFGNKKLNNSEVGVVYIGDGTLGEGVVYETLNFISKHNIPLIVVCENNQYAQSTPSSATLAGSIEDRAKAFGIEYRRSSTFDGDASILDEAAQSISYVRENQRPLFHQVDTYRLKAHSKGDDDRDQIEIKSFEKRDFINLYADANPEDYNKIRGLIEKEIDDFVKETDCKKELRISDYVIQNTASAPKELTKKPFGALSSKRLVARINGALRDQLSDKKTILIGEDIVDPYGGAFKVTKGLSTDFPDRVISTPISEALIAGLSNGLALRGFKPIAEFMFGDFMTLAFDQMLNHAAKFHFMYNRKINCGVVFRTPMGGGRGYGPTHSQSIEKHFIGMETFTVFALNRLLCPKIIYSAAGNSSDPAIVIENKIEYGKTARIDCPEGFEVNIVETASVPIILIEPEQEVDLAIICYGGMVDEAIKCLEQIIVEGDLVPKVILVSQLDPIQSEIFSLTSGCNNIIFLEESTEGGTVGDYFLSRIAQTRPAGNYKNFCSKRVSIPSAKTLEKAVMAKIKVEGIISN